MIFFRIQNAIFSLYKKILSMTEGINLSVSDYSAFWEQEIMYHNLKVTPQALIDLRIR
jgi:hypothetical protein